MLEYPVVILAGGLGTRLAPFNPGRPKALVPVAGEPFVRHQLRLLQKQRCQKVIFCLGVQGEMIEEFLSSCQEFAPMAISFSRDGEELLGTGGAVVKVARTLDRPFAVLYGDSYLDIDFGAPARQFEQAGKLALMTVLSGEHHSVPVNTRFENGIIREYNKVAPTAGMKHVDFGLSFFQPQALAEFEDTAVPFDLGCVFQQLSKRGELAGAEVWQQFYEVGTADGVRELERYLAANQEAI